ncbi:GNAT family protein [uncultured Ferrimonas sp.]|uniref:GNAT family N-acetyltransferase n=1 Tax=uncultured Ferrimonas sp. TaxID=432640 RepID=UPI00260EDEB4|nr:GNAT family protein [uncultured Ferrimonas sp.]
MKLPNQPIITARCRLRPVQRCDASALMPLYSDVEAMRYWSCPPFTKLTQAQHLVDRGVSAWQSDDSMMWLIKQGSTGQIVGTLSVFALSAQNRRAEVGYMLSRSMWGQGLMSEALGAIVHLCFADMGLNRLEADIDPNNGGSARLLQRLGFQHEGRLRQRWVVDGVKSDSDLYGLLKSDWLATAAAVAMAAKTNKNAPLD